MRSIKRLEIHLAHACNLSCESCSHYSDQGHRGGVDLAEAERWLASWSGRLAPRLFDLLGGEPAINPQLTAFVPLVRRYFPETRLRIITNGFLLHRHPTLPKVLTEDGDSSIIVSVHHGSPEYTEALKPVRKLLRKWERDFGIVAKRRKSFSNWTRRYRGFGSEMEPFDDRNPRQSWEMCDARHCTQLFEGKLWKCSPLAYLGMQDKKYGLSESWEPYLKYRPLEPGCSDAELNEFFDREDESYCSMCPSYPRRFEKPLPLAQSSRV